VKRDFLDLHTHSLLSGGVDSPSRMLREAEELEIRIGLCDSLGYEGPWGIEIAPRSKRELKAKLSQYAKKGGYLVVRGGDDRVNRWAASDDRVDILAHPGLGRRDSGIDTVIAREAGKNRVAVEVNLREILQVHGNYRVYVLKNLRRNLLLSRKYGFPLIVASGALSRYDLRGAEGTADLLGVLGFTEEEVWGAMVDTPLRILEGVRRRRKEAVPGVLPVSEEGGG
jgi:ribonuclease P/MRP protein subunit RPP1